MKSGHGDLRRRCGSGLEPFGGLLRDRAGNFYGTTYTGGTDYGGTVFKLTPRAARTKTIGAAG